MTVTSLLVLVAVFSASGVLAWSTILLTYVYGRIPDERWNVVTVPVTIPQFIEGNARGTMKKDEWGTIWKLTQHTRWQKFVLHVME